MKSKQLQTKVPHELAELFENLCKKENITPYIKLRELIAEACKIDLERGWVIKPKSNQERKDK